MSAKGSVWSTHVNDDMAEQLRPLAGHAQVSRKRYPQGQQEVASNSAQEQQSRLLPGEGVRLVASWMEGWVWVPGVGRRDVGWGVGLGVRVWDGDWDWGMETGPWGWGLGLRFSSHMPGGRGFSVRLTSLGTAHQGVVWKARRSLWWGPTIPVLRPPAFPRVGVGGAPAVHPSSEA